jgi:hypothetical protein
MESAGVRMVPGAIFGVVAGAWARAVRGRQQRVRAAAMWVRRMMESPWWDEGRVEQGRDERNVRDV